MNLGEIKNEIIQLGFEEKTTLNDYQSIIISGINRAIKTINSTVKPIVRNISIKQDGFGDEKLINYNISEMTRENGKNIFEDFTKNMPMIIDINGDYRPLKNYFIKSYSCIMIDRDEVGKIDIFYKKIPETITVTTVDSFEIELEPSLHILVPLLASYYIWLDDEERKAVSYYNEYENLKKLLIESETIETSFRARIVGGLNF